MSSPLVPSAGGETDAAGHLAGCWPSVSRPRPVASDLLAADPGPWAAHSCNIAFNEEIGHFDYCTRMTVPTGTCNGGLEGAPGDQEPTDADDTAASGHPPPCSLRSVAATPLTRPVSTGRPIWPTGRMGTPAYTRHRSCSPARSPGVVSASTTPAWRSSPTRRASRHPTSLHH